MADDDRAEAAEPDATEDLAESDEEPEEDVGATGDEEDLEMPSGPLPSGRPPLEPDSLTPSEKRFYLMALVGLARSDEHVRPAELQIIQRVARRLDYRLRLSDFETYDLHTIASEIRRPSLRDALFEDLQTLAEADREWAPGELRTLKFLAGAWDVDLPELPGIDWDEVPAPDPMEVERIATRRRREMVRRRRAIRHASPGFRGRFVLLGTVIYVSLLVAFAFLALLVDPDLIRRTVEEGDLTMGIVGVAASCVLTGLVVARVSGRRTVHEPALGAVVPGLLLVAVAARLGAHWGEARLPRPAWQVAGIVGGACLVQYVLTYVGAWIGEGTGWDR